MRWILASSRWTKRPAFAALAVALVLAVLILGATPAEALEWPHGWSAPRDVGLTVWHHGHRVAPGTDGIWFALAEEEAGQLSLRARLVSLETAKSAVNVAIPLAHSLRDYALTAHERNAWLGWIERQEGTMSTLWLAEITPEATLTKHLLWQSAAFADGPELYIDNHGVLYAVFTSSGPGLARVRLLVWDTVSKKLLNDLTLTDGSALTQRPAVVADGDEVHLVYFRQDQLETYAIYQRHTTDGTLLNTINLGLVPANHKLSPTLLPDGRGALHMVWQSYTGIGDRVVAGAPKYGILRGGKWERDPMAVGSPHRGRIASVRASRGNNDSLLLSWVTESSGLWQAYSVELDPAGQRLSAGFATIAAGSVVEPRPFRVGTTYVISYSQIQPAGDAVVSFVATDLVRKESLAFRLGLDVNRPWLDLAYKYAAILTAAAGYSFGATGALVIGLLAVYLLSAVGLVSSSRRGKWLRLMVLFSVLMMLKLPATPLYFGALMLPGWSAVVSWLGSVLFSISIVLLAGADVDDFFVLGLAAWLFVFCDSFVSLYFYGAGRW